jgi:nitrogen fixation/metabolism regulation signal transduction histidine kinase
LERRSFYEKFINSLDREIINKEDIKKSLINLSKSNSIYLSIFDSLDEGIVLTDLDGYPIFYNKKSSVLFEQIKKNSILQVLPEEVIRNFEITKNEDKTTQIICSIKVFKSSYYLKFVINKIQLYDGETAILIVFYDINAQIKEEREKQIEKSFSNLMEMMYTLAHEIRNPLTSLDLNIKIAQKQIEDTETCSCPNCKSQLIQSLNTTSSEIKRLNRILDTFLSSSKPLQPKLTALNLNEVIKELFSLMKSQFQLSNKNLILKLKENIPPILADKDLLIQAIVNLVKNAFEAISENQTVIIATYDIESDVILEIKDNGPGMDSQTIQKIFNPFFTSKSTGTGLGLTIVYRIIQSILAEIDVESEPGAGTTFRIIFDSNKVKHSLLYSDLNSNLNEQS